MTKQRHSKKEAIQRIESERSHLWSQMLEALSQTRGRGGVDALDKDGRHALEAELSELVDFWEELDVKYIWGHAHSDLQMLWHQYHELGEQLMDIRDTDTTLEDYDPNPDPSLTKEKAIEELQEVTGNIDDFVEDAETAGISREELDEMFKLARHKILN